MGTVIGSRLMPAMLALIVGACGGRLPWAPADQLTIAVRNEMDRPAVLIVTAPWREDPEQVTVIAEPIAIAAGEERDVTFTSPRASWSLRMQGRDGFFDSEELHELAEQLATGRLLSFRLIITPNGDLGLQTSS